MFKAASKAFLIFIIIICCVSLSSHATNDQSIFDYNKNKSQLNNMPRFKKSSEKIIYFGIGFGTNVYDKTVPASYGLPDSVMEEMFKGEYSSLMTGKLNTSAFPNITFGHIPKSTRKFRQQVEFSALISQLKTPLNSSDTITYVNNQANEIEFNEAGVRLNAYRLTYDALLQHQFNLSPISIFAGVGGGLYINDAKALGTKTTSPDSGSGSGGDFDGSSNSNPNIDSGINTNNSASTLGSDSIASNTTIGLTFHPEAGMTFNLQQGISVQLKARYVFYLNPFFGYNTVSDAEFSSRQGVEILFDLLIKI